jgi:GrpB-like predicted nucleotidyltransferase (UPF0157 family)
VTWVTRTDHVAPIREIPDDPLEARRRLAARANEIAADPRTSVTHIRSAQVSTLHETARDTLNVDLVHGDGSFSTVVDVDVVMALTGYGPDLHIDRELQVHRCYATEGTMNLAALLLADGSEDCMQQRSFGPESLRNPEPDFYCLGSKSYGRNSTFLLGIGHEQIRDAFRLITGDSDLDLYAER